MLENLNSVHDGKLLSIQYQEDESIRIRIKKIDGEELSILLKNIYIFVAQNVLDGNIVFEANTVSGRDISNEDISYIAKFEGKMRDETMLAEKIRSENLQVLLLEPSYGAEIICVCSELFVE